MDNQIEFGAVTAGLNRWYGVKAQWWFWCGQMATLISVLVDVVTLGFVFVDFSQPALDKYNIAAHERLRMESSNDI